MSCFGLPLSLGYPPLLFPNPRFLGLFRFSGLLLLSPTPSLLSFLLQPTSRLNHAMGEAPRVNIFHGFGGEFHYITSDAPSYPHLTLRQTWRIKCGDPGTLFACRNFSGF